jgi:hypothetical protein
MERTSDRRHELAAVGTLMTLALLSCNSTTPPQFGTTQAGAARGPVPEPANTPPPLVVDMDEPLLLDEPAEDEQVLGVTTAADNAQCFVCHANYEGESLTSRHAEIGMGCTACHGESLAHKNDENNTTPPETMFPTEKIDPSCRHCHSSHDVAPIAVVARWLERGAKSTDADTITCTVCHGDHRMKVRTVIWDKRTGRLLRTNRER